MRCGAEHCGEWMCSILWSVGEGDGVNDEGRVTPLCGVWCVVGIVVVFPWMFCVVVLIRRNEVLCVCGCGSGVRVWCLCVVVCVVWIVKV